MHNKEIKDPIEQQTRRTNRLLKLTRTAGGIGMITGAITLGAILNAKQNKGQTVMENSVAKICFGTTLAMALAYRLCDSAYSDSVNRLRKMLEDKNGKTHE